jgi:hypothetical protein
MCVRVVENIAKYSLGQNLRMCPTAHFFAIQSRSLAIPGDKRFAALT